MHFACHTKEPATLLFFLDEQEYNLIQGSLDSYEDRSNYQVVSGFLARPFIFLNACISSDIQHPLKMRDLTREFLDFNAGGVISTSCDVPDVFASMFAIEFYKRLFGIKIVGDRKEKKILLGQPMSVG